jgi:VPDSG-CTERM motif
MRNLSKTMLAVLATGLLSSGLFCQQAKALSGEIEFFGKASASGASCTTCNTTISFTNPGWKVLSGTDGYAFVPFGTAAHFNNFSFHGDGVTATLLGGPIVAQWSFTAFNGTTTDTYTFNLETLTSAHVQAGSMAFTGTGTTYIDGVSAGAGTWSLQGSATGGFSFKLSSSTTAVPDGGSAVALLGIALAGIEVVRRRIKAKA